MRKSRLLVCSYAAMDLGALTADDSFLADLGKGVWLMDDHRWALKVWETQRRDCRYSLIHADYHWDACYDFQEQPSEEAALLTATPTQVATMVAADKLIRYDSFIAPAVRRGFIGEIHFYCLQDGPGDNAFGDEFLQSCGAVQFFHDSQDQLAAAEIDKPIIFDLCLDLFNRSELWATGDLWTDSEVLSFLEATQHWIASAELVTVSMSFNYSGTADDTRHLTTLVVPRLLALRGG